MEKKLDKKISERVRTLMETTGVKGTAIANLLDIRPSSASDLILGKSPWRITYLVKVALHFRLTLEELIFNDAEFTKKEIVKQQKFKKEELLKYADSIPDSGEFKELVLKVLEEKESNTKKRKAKKT